MPIQLFDGGSKTQSGTFTPMVPYNRDREPSVSLWNSGSIQASIVLDQPGNVAFTNLDEISGRVVLKCLKSVNVSSIIVKLEGESKTRLLGSTVGPHNDDPKLQLEYHKVESIRCCQRVKAADQSRCFTWWTPSSRPRMLLQVDIQRRTVKAPIPSRRAATNTRGSSKYAANTHRNTSAG